MPVRENNISVNKIMRSWLVVLLCMVLIFILSSIPGDDMPAIFPLQDIVYHFIIFAALAYFFSRATKNTISNIKPRTAMISAFIFGLLYGVTDELHQAFVPYRDVSGLDVFIDGIGSIVGGLINR